AHEHGNAPSEEIIVEAIIVHDGEIDAAVASEVARHDGGWQAAHGVGDLRLEGPVAVAQEHRDVVVRGVGDGEVGPAAASEVACDDGVWLVAHGVGDLCLEGAVTVAQQDGDVVGVFVGDGEVGPAVTREVGRDDGGRVASHGYRLERRGGRPEHSGPRVGA